MRLLDSAPRTAFLLERNMQIPGKGAYNHVSQRFIVNQILQISPSILA